MNFHQPNEKYRSWADLNEQELEHFEVALSFGEESFTAEEFMERHSRKLPAPRWPFNFPVAYCFNRSDRGSRDCPRFLVQRAGPRYSFVGIDGHGDRSTTERPAGEMPPPGEVSLPATPRVLTSRTRTDFSSTRRFVPAATASLILNGDVAAAAIRACNSDAEVETRERRPFFAVGSGFVRHRVEFQLRALDRSYNEWSLGDDLPPIAQAIEAGWEDWTKALAGLTDLSERVPDVGAVRTLLGLFPRQLAVKEGRSFSTRALHFALPRTFCPTDGLAVNILGRELDAGSWAGTFTLDVDEMAIWYVDYLSVVHQLGQANRDLLSRLLTLDRMTWPGPVHERFRGLPRVIDKILWWVGKESREPGTRQSLFMK